MEILNLQIVSFANVNINCFLTDTSNLFMLLSKLLPKPQVCIFLSHFPGAQIFMHVWICFKKAHIYSITFFRVFPPRSCFF